MKKKDMDKQREIGKQLFLVDIIHDEYDKARKGRYDYLSIDRLAAWASMTDDELTAFIKICDNLECFNMAADAAEECCEDELFNSEMETYGFVLNTYLRMGDLYTVTIDIDEFEDCCIRLSERNYQEYTKTHEEFPVARSFSTPEIFEKMMRFYIRYLVTIINEVLSEGYDWDVIIHMMRKEITKERYNSLAELVA